jgi:type IV pilus assembly protein PilW
MMHHPVEKRTLAAKPGKSGALSEVRGFTLVEVLVALVVAMIALGAVFSTFIVQEQHFGNQRQVTRAQQNLRGALLILEQELRMVGYDPEDSGGFGVVDVRRYDLVHQHECNPDGQPVLFYTYDVDEDGRLDDTNNQRNKEHAKFRISDIHNDGHVCLTWDNGAGRNPLAENIQALGFAYAIDVDGDSNCDSWPGGGSLIWAVDSDNDNRLDADIDTNGDGAIDEKDDMNGDHRIDAADGRPLNPPVSPDCIKAVRVWVLAVTSDRLRGRVDDRVFVVGDRVLAPVDDGKKRFVLQTQVHCRNL